jgi:exodeoxyribonuclease VII small subunit
MSQASDEPNRRAKRGAPEPAHARPFEDDLAELDEIVARLEDGKLPLDEALTLYERGVRLALACQRRLDEAALRVSQLRATSVREPGEQNDAGGYTLESIEFEIE